MTHPRLPQLLLSMPCILAMCGFVSAQAQHFDPFNNMSSPTNTIKGYETHGGATLMVTVYAESTKKRLDRQSLLKITNGASQNVSWQTTNEESEGGFGDLPFGHYDLEVSAVGYLTAHREFQAISSMAPIKFEIVLEKDPTAVNIDITDGLLPPKARKDAKHGVSALKSGKWDEANKRLEAAYKIAPSNADLNFLLGYVNYQKKQFGRAEDFLGTATTLSPNNVQALTLLGRLSIQQENYGRAVSNLERAVVADSDYWVAHDLLATSYLKQQDYEKARDEATAALSKAKGNAPASQLVLGQALVNLGKKDDGIKALREFMAAAPANPSVPQVKALIAQLEMPETIVSGSSEHPAPRTLLVDPMIAAAEPTFSVRPWQPAGIDTNKPSIAGDVSCPTQNVLDATSARVRELVSDVSRIAAIEHLLHEQLDEMGNPITKENRTFNYVANIYEDTPGYVGIDEFRQEHLGIADFPDQIASSGFAGLALVFHPTLRENFDMVCEGLGQWRGQATWLVHFRQREDRPARVQDYKVGGEVYSMKLKGRAWITADKFQIVRIESELVAPLPQIRLAGEHQVVEYGPVPFAKRNLQLWLPQSAEIYLDFRRHRYYRKHSFDHYMLFAVDADEKRKEPAPQAPPPN